MKHNHYSRDLLISRLSSCQFIISEKKNLPFVQHLIIIPTFRTAQVVDCRNPEVSLKLIIFKKDHDKPFLKFVLSLQASCKSWKLKGEVECAIWNHFSPFYFLVRDV